MSAFSPERRTSGVGLFLEDALVGLLLLGPLLFGLQLKYGWVRLVSVAGLQQKYGWVRVVSGVGLQLRD